MLSPRIEPYNHRTELFEVALQALARAKQVPVEEVKLMQEAMLRLSIDWEEIQSRLKHHRIDSFEFVVDAIVQLAATAIAMSAVVQAKLLNQKSMQLTHTADVEPSTEPAVTKITRTGKKRIARKTTTKRAMRA